MTDEQRQRIHAITYSTDDRAELAERIVTLEEENAKLRELVRILYYCGLPWKNCDKCAMNGAEMHVKISDVQFCDDMYDHMRELGIESEA